VFKLISNEELLIGIMEECAEVTQAVSKALRFGLDAHNPHNISSTNADDIMTEFYHVDALIEELQKRNVLPMYSIEHTKAIKSNKIRKMKRWFKNRLKSEGNNGK